MHVKVHPQLSGTLIKWDDASFFVDIDLNDKVSESRGTANQDDVSDWLRSVNVILLSNFISAAKLVLQFAHFVQSELNPLIKVYASRPTFDLMRFCLEESINSYISDSSSTASSNSEIREYMRANHKQGLNVQRIYQFVDLLSTQVTYTAFGESTPLDLPYQLTCSSSGFTIGSTNWTVEHGNQKLVLISDSSSEITRFPEPLDIEQLGYADVCVLSTSNMSLRQPTSWSDSMQELEQIIFSHAHHKRPLIFPLSVTGNLFFDILHAMCRTLESNPNLLKSSLVLIVSPVMNAVTEYVNISSEHLNAAQKDRTFHGLLPMIPNALTDPIYKSAFMIINSPCDLLDCTVLSDVNKSVIIIAGHESLCRGDVLTLMDILAAKVGRPASVCVTDPEFSGLYSTFMPPKGIEILNSRLNPRLNRSGLFSVLNSIKPINLVTNCGSRAPFKNSGLFNDIHTHFVVPNADSYVVDLPAIMYHAYMNSNLAKLIEESPGFMLDDQTKAYTVPVLWDHSENQLKPVSTIHELEQAAVHPPVYRGRFDLHRFHNELAKMYPRSHFNANKQVIQILEHGCEIQFDESCNELDIQFDGPESDDVIQNVSQVLSNLMESK